MFLSPLLSPPGASRRLANATRGTVLATHLETAFDSASRNRGLLGRAHLDDGSAIVLAPCGAVHTFGMRFPVDAVFVARDGRVVKVCEALPPWRLSGAWRGFAVVEGPVGMIARTGTRARDLLVVE